jgi:type I restriction enzyme S subunit
MLFQAKSGICTSEYLWALLCSRAIYHQAALNAGGAASPHVNIKDIRQFKCVLPPYGMQVEFSNVCKRGFRMRERAVAALQEAVAFDGSLGQRAFSGEL